jgi:Calcineurin-like phosphoesterase
MPDIRYVIISDLHFGAQNSVLTNVLEDESGRSRVDPDAPSPVMRSLVECLQELIYANEHWALPTLVLGGDVLELALADDDVAAMAFERFMELVLLHSEPLFDRTVYFVPGNHDHHLWEGAREAHYAKSVRNSDKSQQRTLDPPRHATHLVAATDKDPWTAPLLEALIHREPELRDVQVHTIYPNLAIVDDEGTRAVVFHHGHYAESLYRLVSTITGMMFPDKKKPEEVHEWEAENFAWVDFFWSTLGRSGGAGDDVGLAYDYLQSKAATEYLVGNLVDGFGRHSDRAMVRRLTPLLEPALKRVTHHVIERERRHTARVLRDDTETGLAEYVEGPLRRQLARACNDDIPEHVTFLFGHTHKPFVGTRPYAGYRHWVTVANTGGWVVDTVDPNPLHGAAVILLDENLNGLSVKMYSQEAGSERYEVVVKAIPSTGGSANEFLRRVQTIIDSNREPWSELSSTAARAVRARGDDLRQIITRADAFGRGPGS